MKILGMRGMLAALSVCMGLPAAATTPLQCVPYARLVSGVSIYGDARTWWDQAQGRYKRGHSPKRGAVLAFRPTGPMVLGHVAVVSRIVDDRQVLVRHANWSAPGAIEEDVLAVDVSEDGDWSAVRVWHSPTGQMGARVNPTFGFIYPDKARLNPFAPDDSIRLAGAPETTMPVKAVKLAFASLPKSNKRPRINYDPAVIGVRDAKPSDRSLDDIIADVQRVALGR